MTFIKSRFMAILSVLTLTIVQGCAPKADPCYIEYVPSTTLTSVNIIDRNGMSETISSKERLKKYQEVDWLSPQPFEKVLRVYSRDSIGEIHAYITSYYENGLPKQYLEVVNARAKGSYREWHENGVKKLEANVIGGEADLTAEAQKSWLFDGVSNVWDDCGNPEAKISYANGVLEGPSLYYHKNGAVWKSVPFCQGTIEGLFVIYFDTGAILQTTQFSGGKKHGATLRYWPCGSVSADELFCQDELKTGHYWDIKGNLITEVIDGQGTRAVFGKETVVELQEINHGAIEGEIRSLGPSGEILRSWHVLNGLKHGEEIEYYPINYTREALRPQLSINWWEGKMQGVMKTWYPNGVQESQREMTANKKNGYLTGWYADGAIMLMEEYDQDRLVRGQYYRRGEKKPVSELKDGTGTATLYDSEGHLIQRVNYFNGHIE